LISFVSPSLTESSNNLVLTRDTALRDQLHEAASEVDPLGVHVKDAISTISRLQGLGLQNRDIPLPKVIVLGELRPFSRLHALMLTAQVSNRPENRLSSKLSLA
jgi:hypothetical protein